MRIDAEMLRRHGACAAQVKEVARLWPRGTEPTVEALIIASAHGLDVLWLLMLLPAEGPGSRRAFALWCAEQVADFADDKRVADCLAVVRRRVEDSASVSDADLDAARAAAWAAAGAAAGAAAWDAAWAAAGAAAWAAAGDAAWDAARAAARAAAWAAAGDAQIACLAQLLSDAEEPALGEG